MDQRTSRKQIAENTLQELKQGYYVNSTGDRIAIKDDVQKSIDTSRLYLRQELDALITKREPASISSAVKVTGDSTLQCLTKVFSADKRVALLNFASAKNPGGGFLGGSQAQEESLARSGGLYPTLTHNTHYYEKNKQSADTFYHDNLIYSPQVIFFKNDDGDYLDQYIKSDVITMPAVNKGALKFVDDKIQKEIDDVMKRRMKYVLAVSEKNNVDILILGAWGCGVFRNDPERIADNFREVLTQNKFKIPQVVFAVLDRDQKAHKAFEQLSRLL